MRKCSRCLDDMKSIWVIEIACTDDAQGLRFPFMWEVCGPCRDKMVALVTKECGEPS